jgi:hypothetical protein
LEFEFQYGQEFSLFHIVQTGSGVQSTSYPIGTRVFFSGGKSVKLTIYLQLVPGQENLDIFVNSPYAFKA